MTALFCGVDAGNSKTVALVADEHGRVLGRGRAGTGDIYGVQSASVAVAAVITAMRIAVHEAGGSLSSLRHTAFRLAGVDWPEDEHYWHGALAREVPELVSYCVKNDGYALLRCGELSGAGIAVTAGTGAAVAARGWEGQEYCAGWWIQEPLGGRDLGPQAFRAVVAAELGTSPSTLLTERLLDLYGVPDVATLLHTFTSREHRRPARDQWRAARTVLMTSDAGDPVARAIVERHAVGFADHTAVAALRVGFRPEDESVPLVLGGSLLTSEHPALRHALTAALAERGFARAPYAMGGSPVSGALLDALAEGGVALDLGIRDRVVQALHPSEFLLT